MDFELIKAAYIQRYADTTHGDAPHPLTTAKTKEDIIDLTEGHVHGNREEAEAEMEDIISKIQARLN